MHHVTSFVCLYNSWLNTAPSSSFTTPTTRSCVAINPRFDLTAAAAGVDYHALRVAFLSLQSSPACSAEPMSTGVYGWIGSMVSTKSLILAPSPLDAMSLCLLLAGGASHYGGMRRTFRPQRLRCPPLTDPVLLQKLGLYEKTAVQSVGSSGRCSVYLIPQPDASRSSNCLPRVRFEQVYAPTYVRLGLLNLDTRQFTMLKRIAFNADAVPGAPLRLMTPCKDEAGVVPFDNAYKKKLTSGIRHDVFRILRNAIECSTS
ncbi:hypothetical protein C8R43DRAFT_1203203 [Mycena crocata]|nr:hypothetical protein C8R43DRAFT_1203203 [Mycena crocata]